MEKNKKKLGKNYNSMKQKSSNTSKTIIVPSNGVPRKTYSSSARPNLSKLQRVTIP